MRCPTCRARLRELSVCQRCGTDLTLVIGAANEAQKLTTRAVHHLLDDAPLEAARALNHALRLQRSDARLALRAFIIERQERQAVQYLGEGQLSAALSALNAVQALQGTPMATALRHFISRFDS